MNGNEDDLDLGLTLGYSNSCIRTRLNNNSGAGVNAGRSVEMTFAASDPLSELVWSPHKGLSLKCADCSKADKKPFLSWNVGPSNIVPSPSRSIRYQETIEEKIVDGNLILSHATLDVDSDVAKRDDDLVQSNTCSAMPVIKTSRGEIMESRDILEGQNADERVLTKHSSENEDKFVNNDQKEVCSPQMLQMTDMNVVNQRNTGQLSQNPFVQENQDSSHDMEVNKSLCGDLNKEFSGSCDDPTNKVPGRKPILAGVTTASDIHAEVQSRPHTNPSLKSPCPDGTTERAILATEEENKKLMNMSSSMFPSLEKLECTAENDLHDHTTKEACGQSEERLPRGSHSVPLGNSPIDGNQRRGKSRAISDGNFSGRFSNDEDDSHESVESCNSAGLLSKGKKRLKYDENFVFESKRLKQIDEGPSSMSAMKNDSSFMNWISNMVKGFCKSNDEEDHSLSHGAHADPKNASFLQETMICGKQNESSSRNMGFQTVFHSLYSQNTKLREARASRDDCKPEGSRGLVQVDKANTPGSPGRNTVPCENFMSIDKITPSTPDDGVHSGLPYTFSTTIPVQVDNAAELAENKASASPQHHRDKDGVNSSESGGMHLRTKLSNENPEMACEGRTVNGMPNKSNLFGSLWITRLSSKTGSSPLNLDPSKPVSAFCEAGKPDFAMKEKCSEERYSSNQSSGEFLVKELLLFAANTGCSVGFKDIHGHNPKYSVLKINPTLSSQALKRSEEMATVFARRLDALKHILPLGSENGATCAPATCFYCGKSGHNLRDCSEVTESELDHLLRNISSYVSAECPCLCIRCFQPDHWAAACPRGSSSRQHFLNLKLLPIDERSSQSLEKEDDNKGAACSREKSCTYLDIRNPMINGDSLGQRGSSSNETQKGLTSNSRENNSEEFHNMHLTNLVSTHVIRVPQGIIDAARRLQVSRTDILRLMKSHVLVPHLEGLFLRLRLGKWEAGLGGTGYYVACITGQAGNAVKDLKKSISVNVGGIKCQVGSQYVSNQDFLEDEFTAWWCRALRSGGKLPSKEDLESKLNQRINLGF